MVDTDVIAVTAVHPLHPGADERRGDAPARVIRRGQESPRIAYC
jgi:hypothetical protein